jgi:hypothetical protein
MKVTSNVATFRSRSTAKLGGEPTIDCRLAHKLMSPYIDSMATPLESQQLEGHLEQCPPCGRELQSYISNRNLLAGIEPPVPPQDMVLESRVRLSHERYDFHLEWLRNRLANALNGLAVPAFGGVLATTLLFGLLFVALVPHEVSASVRHTDNERMIGFEQVAATSATTAFFASNERGGLKEPFVIALQIGDDGRPFDYSVLAGDQSPEVREWIAETLSLARFSPATVFGRPVGSTFIYSFLPVRS